MLTTSEHNELRSKFESMCLVANGINFWLCMRNPDNSLEIYHRTSQPCYGELRKYRATHGDECTQDVKRPSDLRSPFPKGIPEAVGFHFNNISDANSLIEYIWSPQSPWATGAGTEVNFVKNKQGMIKGLYLTDTEIDPTVMVNLIKVTAGTAGSSYSTLYNKYVAEGIDKDTAILLSPTGMDIFTYGIPGALYQYFIMQPANYTRFWLHKPRDLTGGTFRNRWDYNRPDLLKIFSVAPGEESVNFVTMLKPRVKFTPAKSGGKRSLIGFVDALAEVKKEILSKKNIFDVKAA